MTTEPSFDMEIDSTAYLKMHLQTSLQKFQPLYQASLQALKQIHSRLCSYQKGLLCKYANLKRAVLAVSVYVTAQLSRENKLPSFQPC